MKTIIAVLFLCSVALIALVIHLDNRNLALVKENFALQAKLLGSSLPVVAGVRFLLNTRRMGSIGQP